MKEYWKTAAGWTLHVTDMQPTHLINAIAKLERLEATDTDDYRMLVRELQRRKTTPFKEKNMKKFWIIWNPNHHQPPTVRFDTIAKAQATAAQMAERFKPDTFFVCQAVSASQIAPVVQPVKTVKLS